MTDEVKTYAEKHAVYYNKHKESINEKEKEAKRWLSYYERNKDVVRRRNLERYHKKREDYFTSPEYLTRMKELDEIVSRLSKLIPEVVKTPRRRRSTENNPEVPA